MKEMALLKAIIDSFLQPTMDRLSEQLQRRIELAILMKVQTASCEGSVVSGETTLEVLEGAVRILASDTAIPDRYKYELQGIFSDAGLDGFSGVRLRGAVRILPQGAANEYSGFTYTYNDWAWSAKLRDL